MATEPRKPKAPQVPDVPLSERAGISVPEFAGMLGIGLTLARRLVMTGQVPSRKVGKLRRVPLEAARAFMANRDPQAA